MSEPDAARGYCARCGELPGDREHTLCESGLALEPPRYCTQCGRRMVVKVMPRGWQARCAVHGVISG